MDWRLREHVRYSTIDIKTKSIVRAIVGYRERSKTRWISIVEWPDAIRLLWFLKVKRRRSPFHRFRNYAFRVARVPD